MSKNLSTLAVKKFEAEVHHEFTGMASKDYKELARLRYIEAKKTQFPVFGYNKMAPHIKGAQIAAANGARTAVEVELSRFSISDFTDIFDDKEVNFSERQEFVKSIAKSFRNQGMQVLIDALTAGTAVETIAKNVTGSNDNFNVTMVREAARALDEQGAPSDGRIILAPAACVHALAREPEVASSDYMNRKIYETGRIEGFYGFDIVSVGNMPEGGIPLSGTDATFFAYQKDAVGLAVGVDQEITIDWENTYGMWSVSGFLSAGAKVIDGNGLVKIVADTAIKA